MIDLLVKIIGPLLRVEPVAPHIPAGACDVEVFRASPRYLSYRYALALIPLLFMLLILASVSVVVVVAAASEGQTWIGVVVAVLILSVLAAVSAVRLVAIKLDYEYHHYVITDRSLRIRRGIWEQLEATLTYANVQNVRVEQGPIERMFDIASVFVDTAGGKSDAQKDPMQLRHRGVIRGIEDAGALRDKIMRRVGHDRSSGLGDLDDHHHQHPQPGLSHALLIEIRDEARALAQLGLSNPRRLT